MGGVSLSDLFKGSGDKDDSKLPNPLADLVKAAITSNTNVIPTVAMEEPDISKYGVPGSVKATGHPEQKDWWPRHHAFLREHMDLLKDNPYMYYDQDLATQRNITGKSSENIQRLSRLADALNNTYYRGPAQFSFGGAATGGAYQGTTSSVGEQYRMPIETEEMRSMERMRGYEEIIRAAEIARQQQLQGLPLEQAKARLAEQLRETYNLSEQEIKQAQLVFEYILGYHDLRRQTAFARWLFAAQQNITGIGLPMAQAKLLDDQLLKNPTLAEFFGSASGAAPLIPETYQTIFKRYVAAKIADIPNPTPADMQRAYVKTVTDMGVDTLATILHQSRPVAQQIYDAFITTWGTR